ncbi:hypothetical protein [Lentzea fradiae]|nr:hypothetical protein [Lentzea fradiae]
MTVLEPRDVRKLLSLSQVGVIAGSGGLLDTTAAAIFTRPALPVNRRT